MNTNLLPIAQYTQQCAVGIDAVSIAAGMAVSRFVNLPSSEVESVNVHYVEQAQAIINQYLSAINEDIPLDIDKATKIARGSYLLRYFSAFPKSDGSVVLPSEGNFFEKYLSINIYFDTPTKEYVDGNAELLINLINRFLVVLPCLVK